MNLVQKRGKLDLKMKAMYKTQNLSYVHVIFTASLEKKIRNKKKISIQP